MCNRIQTRDNCGQNAVEQRHHIRAGRQRRRQAYPTPRQTREQRDPQMLKRIVALVAALTLTFTPVTAQTAGPVSPRVRVTSAGTRISGRLTTVDVDAVTLLPDGNGGPVRIPLSSISRAEVSEGHRPRGIAELEGVGVGVGVWFGTFFLGFAACGGITCSNSASGAWFVGSVAAGIASGIAFAHRNRRELWRRVPVGSLASFVTPVATGPLAHLCLSGCFSKAPYVVYGCGAPAVSEEYARVPEPVRHRGSL